MRIIQTRRGLVGLGAVGVLLAVWSQFGPYFSPLELHPTITPVFSTVGFAIELLWVAAMLITARRDPMGPMWKLILLLLAAHGTWDLGYIPSSLTWTVGSVLTALGDVVLAHIILAFPRGRLWGRFDRAVIAFLYAYLVGTNVLGHLVWDPQFADCSTFCPQNLLLVWRNDELATALMTIVPLLAPILGVAVLVGLWRHWRMATPTVRRALLPLVVGAPVQIGILALWHVAGALGREDIRLTLATALFNLPFAILPAAFVLAVIRARLARGSVADLAVALGRGIPLGGLRDQLAHVLRDPTLVLAFPAPSGGGYVDADGSGVALPEAREGRSTTRLERDGEELALLIHDPATDAEDPGLVEAVGSVARLALENERLSAQVRAQLDEVRNSRQRIVEAADTERRRIERDLHDGAQQRLVALAIRLQTARSTTVGAAELLDDATAQLQAAVSEVRNLARGLHPPILTELGLGPALEALAERSTVPVRVEATDGRFPANVEATAYFVAAEALTNVARHSKAREAVVSVTTQGQQLVLSVQDDGTGGADHAKGSGLRGLADRVEAMGGRLSVESTAGGGTRVTASLPFR